MKFYAGIGSRATPPSTLTLMKALASSLEHAGYTLRSGGAGGADDAFESGVVMLRNRHVYLPWSGFNDNGSPLSLENLPQPIVMHAASLAERFHPAWHRCTTGARKLHTRNSLQILGHEAVPQISDFVVCWTSDGKDSGGTGQALRLARHYQIPVYNLYNLTDKAELLSRFNWSGELLDLAMVAD